MAVARCAPQQLLLLLVVAAAAWCGRLVEAHNPGIIEYVLIAPRLWLCSDQIAAISCGMCVRSVYCCDARARFIVVAVQRRAMAVTDGRRGGGSVTARRVRCAARATPSRTTPNCTSAAAGTFVSLTCSNRGHLLGWSGSACGTLFSIVFFAYDAAPVLPQWRVPVLARGRCPHRRRARSFSLTPASLTLHRRVSGHRVLHCATYAAECI